MGVGLTAAIIGVLSPFNGSAATLARLDPGSLRPTGPRVLLGEYHDAWSFSPDGSQLALGNGGQGRVCGRGICVVDVGDMAVSADVDAPIAVEALAWVRPRRIVGVLQSGGVVVADPVAGAIVQRTPLPFSTRFGEWARTPGGIALLMNARPLRLVVADASGAVRIAPLRRTRPSVNGFPGLAVDRRGRRAFVVAAGAPVAEVDLRTMRVRYHRVALPRPRRRAGGVRSREALWLGRSLMAVFGYDSRGAPAGVRVVDTNTWTARTVDRRAGQAKLTAGRLLVHNSDRFTPRTRRVDSASTRVTEAALSANCSRTSPWTSRSPGRARTRTGRVAGAACSTSSRRGRGGSSARPGRLGATTTSTSSVASRAGRPTASPTGSPSAAPAARQGARRPTPRRRAMRSVPCARSAPPRHA